MAISKDERIKKARKYADSYSPISSDFVSELNFLQRNVYVDGFLQGFEVAGGGMEVTTEQAIVRMKNAEREASLAEFIRKRFADVLDLPKHASWEHIWEVTRSLKGVAARSRSDQF